MADYKPLVYISGRPGNLPNADALLLNNITAALPGSDVVLFGNKVSGDINIGGVGSTTNIKGNLVVDGTETVTSTMTANGDINLGDGGNTIRVGGSDVVGGDTVNIGGAATNGDTITVGGANDDIDVWVNGADGGAQAGPVRLANAAATTAGAYGVGVDAALLANASAPDLMTALDQLDAAITAAAVASSLDAVINTAAPDNAVTIPSANPLVFTAAAADMTPLSVVGATVAGSSPAISLTLDATTNDGVGIQVANPGGGDYYDALVMAAAAVDTDSNSLRIASGNSSGTGSSGDIEIAAGTASGTGSAGGLSLLGGYNTGNNTSGGIFLSTGGGPLGSTRLTLSGRGASGTGVGAELVASASVNGDVRDVQVRTENIVLPFTTGDTGNSVLTTGNAGTTTGTSGGTTVSTGTGATGTGAISIATGVAGAGGTSGDITIATGSGGTSGDILIDSSAGTTRGTVTMKAGTLYHIEIADTSAITYSSSLHAFSGGLIQTNHQSVPGDNTASVAELIKYDDANANISDMSIFAVDATPEGEIVAGPGSIALADTGTLYVKTTGAGNTGWSEIGLSGTPSLDNVINNGGDNVVDIGVGNAISLDGTTNTLVPMTLTSGSTNTLNLSKSVAGTVVSVTHGSAAAATYTGFNQSDGSRAITMGLSNGAATLAGAAAPLLVSSDTGVGIFTNAGDAVDISIEAGDGLTVNDAAGNVEVFAGGSAATDSDSGSAGAIALTAGPATGSGGVGGNVTIRAGAGQNVASTGGSIEIYGGQGQGATDNAGGITIDAGPVLSSASRAGISIGTSNAGAISIGGASASGVSVTAGTSSDLTFGARGSTVTLNESGDTALDGAFTATSIIGALNELISASGTVLTFTAGENLAAGDVVRFSTADTVVKIDADTDTTDSALGFVLAAATSSNPVEIAVAGEVTGFSGLTVGDVLYVAGSGGGTPTSTAPSSNLAQRVAIAASATKVVIQIGENFVL